MTTINDFEKFMDNLSAPSDKIVDVIPAISNNGDLTRIHNINVVINRIINQLSIRKGTYIFNPEYGEMLTDILFDLSDSTTLNKVSEMINRVVQQNKGKYNATFDVKLSKDMKSIFISIVIQSKDKKEKIQKELILHDGSIYERG